MKRILSALAAVASVAALVLGAAGTANAVQQPPIYVSEVAFPGVGVTPFIKIGSTAPLTLSDPVIVELKRDGLPFFVVHTIPAGTTIAPGIGYLIKIGSGFLPCLPQFTRPLFAPPTSTFEVKVESLGKELDTSAEVSLAQVSNLAYHRARPLTPGNFFAAMPNPCGRPD